MAYISNFIQIELLRNLLKSATSKNTMTIITIGGFMDETAVKCFLFLLFK